MFYVVSRRQCCCTSNVSYIRSSPITKSSRATTYFLIATKGDQSLNPQSQGEGDSTQRGSRGGSVSSSAAGIEDVLNMLWIIYLGFMELPTWLNPISRVQTKGKTNQLWPSSLKGASQLSVVSLNTADRTIAALVRDPSSDLETFWIINWSSYRVPRGDTQFFVEISNVFWLRFLLSTRKSELRFPPPQDGQELSRIMLNQLEQRGKKIFRVKHYFICYASRKHITGSIPLTMMHHCMQQLIIYSFAQDPLHSRTVLCVHHINWMYNLQETYQWRRCWQQAKLVS